MIAGEVDLTTQADQQSHRSGKSDGGKWFDGLVVRAAGDVYAEPNHEFHVVVVSLTRNIRQLARIEVEESTVVRFGGDAVTGADARQRQTDIDGTRVNQLIEIINLNSIRLAEGVVHHTGVRGHVGDGRRRSEERRVGK